LGLIPIVPWRRPDGEPVPIDEPALDPLELLDRNAQPCASFRTGETLGVRVVANVPAGGLGLRLRLVQQGIEIWQIPEPAVLAPGRHRLETALEPLNLLAGEFSLLAELLDSVSGAVISAQEQTFVVESARDQGAGVIFQPCCWSHEHAPRPPDTPEA